MKTTLMLVFAVLAIICGVLANKWHKEPRAVALGIASITSMAVAGVFAVCIFI